jgi:hypothetical protein
MFSAPKSQGFVPKMPCPRPVCGFITPLRVNATNCEQCPVCCPQEWVARTAGALRAPGRKRYHSSRQMCGLAPYIGSGTPAPQRKRDALRVRRGAAQRVAAVCFGALDERMLGQRTRLG